MKKVSFFSLYRNDKIIPLFFLVLGSGLMISLWLLNDRSEKERISLESRITAEQIQLRIESCVNTRVSLVRTLGEQGWQNQEQLINQWQNTAASLFPLYLGVQALSYIDQDRVIRVVYPLLNNESALNFDLYNHSDPSVIMAIDKADELNSIARTDVLELVQSGSGFALYHPIISDTGEELGFVNGVFRLADLLTTCLSEERLRDRFVFRLYEPTASIAPFFQQPLTYTGSMLEGGVSLDLDIADRTWRMQFAPSPVFVRDNSSRFDEVWFILGLLMVGLLAWVLHILIQKQNNLSKSEDDYRLLVENQSDMVVKINMDMEFLYVSPSYCKTFGVSEEALLDQKFLPLVHEDDREMTLKSLERLKLPPYHSYHEQRAKTHEGWRWLGWSNTGVLNEQGEVIEITAVGRDVTDIKSLEARIARSQKMHAIGEMAGGITHDFNNLLQVMTGNVEFLLDDMAEGSEKYQQLEKVSEMIERAMTLTNKLSTLSRQQQTENEVIDLNAFIQEMRELLRRTLPGSISLKVQTSPGTLKVLADKTQLEQVLLNICFNARDAISSTGEINITTEHRFLDEFFLGSTSEIPPGEYAIIAIEDNGSGIEPEIMPKIFDPFFTTKGDNTGTGLGLANCYSIIRKNKGTIMVDSEVGKGARFSIYLPLSNGNIKSTSENVNQVIPTSSDDHLILIADDNPEVLALTKSILQQSGLKTLTARDGEEAIALYQANQERITMVILDMVMPNMGGLDALKVIRKSNPAIKALLVSGYIPAVENSAEDIPEHILMKPFKISDLMSKVSEILKGYSGI